jgi:hypothetical protein
VISGFHRDIDEICAILEYYAASTSNPSPTFRDNISVPFSRAKKMESIGYSETSVKDYHSKLRNILEKRRYHGCCTSVITSSCPHLKIPWFCHVLITIVKVKVGLSLCML